MTGAFGSDHEYVCRRRGHDLTKMDVEAMPECQVGPRFQIWCDLLTVDRGLHFVRCQDHDDIRGFHGIGDRHDLEPALLGLPPGSALSQTDHDRDAALLQVEGVGVTLAAVSD